jgi:hypothetical protein
MAKNNKFRKKIRDEEFETESKLQRSLDGFSLKLIKTVGVAGVIIGLAILVAFWWWVIKLLYKVG